jgi:hypothetical protein
MVNADVAEAIGNGTANSTKHTTKFPSNINDDGKSHRGVTKLHSTIVQEMIPYLVLFIGVLHGMYMYFYFIYSNETTMLFGTLKVPTSEYCIALRQQQESVGNKINERCGRPDLFGFQMVSITVFIVSGIIGIHAWNQTTTLESKNSMRYQLISPELRLYGYQSEGHILLLINLSYQIWDFVMSFYVIPEYYEIHMLLHHIISALVAFCGLYNHMFSYYAVFFLGLTEISSIFLVSLDLNEYFIEAPSLSSTGSESNDTPSTTVQSLLSTIFFSFSKDIAGPLFVISFLYYRIILWWYVSLRLWDDVHTVVVRTNSAEELRPKRSYILYIWLYCNLPMGILQIYFLSTIMSEIKAKFFS